MSDRRPELPNRQVPFSDAFKAFIAQGWAPYPADLPERLPAAAWAHQRRSAISAQFPGVGGLKSIDRLRRRRNQSEYPDPHNYDAVSTDEAHDAIAIASACIDAADKLIAAPQLCPFR